MPTFVCSYVSREHKEVSRWGVEDAVKRILDGEPGDISTFRASRTPEGNFRISYDRTFKREIIVSGQLEAIQSFLFTAGLPEDLALERVIVKLVEDHPALEQDDTRHVDRKVPRVVNLAEALS